MKHFVLDCRFDGDTADIVARVIPPLIASNMLAEASELQTTVKTSQYQNAHPDLLIYLFMSFLDGAMFDSADSSTVSSFPPQNALEFSNLPGKSSDFHLGPSLDG